MRKSVLLLLFMLLQTQVSLAASLDADPSKLNKEIYYIAKWCEEQHGTHEFIMSDFTRIDCLTETEAIEFDWAYKWYEAIGQSLYYAYMSGKRAAIVLIAREGNDERYIDRAGRTIVYHRLPINLYVIWK
jgi:hypothetical protein